MNIVCLCVPSKTDGLQIYYFTSTMTSLNTISTTEEILNDIIKQKCSSSIFTILKDFTDVTTANICIQELENLCLQPTYKDTLLLIEYEDLFYLFGLIDSVKNVIVEFEKFKEKFVINQIEHDLKSYQVSFNNKIYIR